MIDLLCPTCHTKPFGRDNIRGGWMYCKCNRLYLYEKEEKILDWQFYQEYNITCGTSNKTSLYKIQGNVTNPLKDLLIMELNNLIWPNSQQELDNLIPRLLNLKAFS